VVISVVSCILSPVLLSQKITTSDTPLPSALSGEQMIEVELGSKNELPLESEAKRIGIETEGVVSAFMPDPGTLELTGVNPGYTVLLIQYADGEIDRRVVQVKAASSEVVEKLAEQLREQLEAVDRLQVTTDGVSIALTGDIDAKGKALIKPYVQMLKGIVIDDTQLYRPPVAPAVVLNGESEPTPTPEPTPPPEPDFSDRIVQIDVQIIQVVKEHGKDLGIDWFSQGPWRLSGEGTLEGGYQASTAGLTDSLIGTGGGQGIRGGGVGGGGVLSAVNGNGGFGLVTGSVTLSNVEVALEALMREGLAKVLATPKLTVQSGKPADFLVGGELPIVQTTALTSTVQFKKFGTQLEIDPVVVAEDEVFITVRAEVSEVDEVQRVQGVPGIRTRQASTFVTVKDGRMFAIAGLLSTESATEDRSVPVLSSIPLIGGLFRKERSIERDLETIILMTPYILREDGTTEPVGARIHPGILLEQVLREPALEGPVVESPAGTREVEP